VNASGALKLVEDGWEDGLEISSGGHAERRLRAERRESQERE
jgi:hypothetical protein